jgi:hypothetical protein
MALDAFMIRLAGRTRINYVDADYFNVSANDERIAKPCRGEQLGGAPVDFWRAKCCPGCCPNEICRKAQLPKLLILLAVPARLELATFGLGNRRSGLTRQR